MSATVHTCLWFNDQAEEAARFYTEVIPNSCIDEVIRYGPGEPMAAGTAMLVRLTLDGHAVSLLNGGPHFRPSPAASLVVRCADQAAVDRCWAALVDRFGVSWQIVPALLMDRLAGPPGPGVQRMTAALRQMRKIDAAALERAYSGR
jgi:predicted 3-demethylubiquinone-9 3-methyltransferase (glyoxalase superfamily)